MAGGGVKMAGIAMLTPQEVAKATRILFRAVQLAEIVAMLLRQRPADSIQCAVIFG